MIIGRLVGRARERAKPGGIIVQVDLPTRPAAQRATAAKTQPHPPRKPGDACQKCCPEQFLHQVSPAKKPARGGLQA